MGLLWRASVVGPPVLAVAVCSAYENLCADDSLRMRRRISFSPNLYTHQKIYIGNNCIFTVVQSGCSSELQLCGGAGSKPIGYASVSTDSEDYPILRGHSKISRQQFSEYINKTESNRRKFQECEAVLKPHLGDNFQDLFEVENFLSWRNTLEENLFRAEMVPD